MEFNITTVFSFLDGLSLLHLMIFILLVEGLEILTGIVNAWRNRRAIKSAITRDSLAAKFEFWSKPMVFVVMAMLTHNEELAKVTLILAFTPELVSIVENIIRSVAVLEKS